MSLATALRSFTKARYSARRLASSVARKIEEGCTVAIPCAASGVAIGFPRRLVTLKVRPNSACAAVAPSATMSRGFRSWSSVSSQNRQAAISPAFGRSWIRRLPVGAGFYLKCFTAFVT